MGETQQSLDQGAGRLCLLFLQVFGNRNPLAGGFSPIFVSFFNCEKWTLL